MGITYRAHSGTLDGAPFGTELDFSAAVGLRLLKRKLLVGPEVFGSTVFDGAFERQTTPFEVILGGKYRPTDAWRVGLGVGPGLTRGFGSPAVRVLASIEWIAPIKPKAAPPPEEPGDRDGDGITDDEDACPDEKGVASDDPDKNGCPEPADRDGDGIVDAKDACPDEKGVASDDPEKNGCPAPGDRDGDGITDDEDACPDEKGVASDDPKRHGCPKDTDGDGILDDEDACPTEKGERNEDPKKNGCPEARVEEKQIIVLGRVEFETGKAVLRPESNEVLDAVLKVLQEHEEITKISVEGHTDDRGADAMNLDLSRRRAAAVVKWLAAHGIAAGRLSSQGFGETKPVESNETDAGRQNNRRVEFRIVERDGKPVDKE
jgi:outer membrane protein OmpA-like peptidoglycan-associated protein